MQSLVLAWRNVWRNSRRTIAAIAATSLGLWAMIVYSALAEGYLVRMESQILDVEMGDVQAFHVEYRKNPSIYHRIEDPDGLLRRLEKAGLDAAPRLLGSGLAAAGESSAGISMQGVDLERDPSVSDIHQHVAEGQWLDAARPGEVVIGRRLGQMLGVGLGDEIVVLAQGADGSMANDLFVVRGILKGVSDAVDRGGIYMAEAAFRELMVVPDGVHQVIVRRGAAPLDAAAGQVRELAPELEAKTWRELKPTLASMLDSSRGALVAMFLIVYAAIGIVILNAMLMAVFERVREFGVLKAIGVSPAGVLRLIYLETMIQTAIAVVVGVLLSLPANWYLTHYGIDLSGSMENLTLMGSTIDPIWRSRVTVESYTGPIITLLIIIAIAVTYPALRAAFIRPIEAMRSQ